ncbi:substrate-binding periplasmic protein [Pseudomonas aeruginosa]|uniref:substrate-binding periplasmic protein n=1 Tax=Pseudomonas aeruginosa TaxID=287 RepID=UPI0018A3C798|nr:bifunctional lytic transglycosylase/amino acid ABC transporter substrate-binding protein [Pseudomonas aeruginosa]QOQ65029.1 bifunctional lytic transglycosylase/amino acid ABC transporter substrate-binding protein [Pseudomonas aeruginosa]
MPLRTTTPLLALLAFALLAAPQLHAQDARPSLNVGYYEFPPYIYTARDGHAAGSGARLVRLLLEWAGAAKPELAADTLQARRVLGHVSLNLYYPAHQPAPRVPQDLAGRRLILISGYSYWKPVTDFIQDPNLHLRLYRTGTHHAALRMLELGRGDYLLDYQAPVEAASRQALASQELYRLPLRMIVSRHIPGAEALRDRLDQAYDQLRSDGADLSLL